MRRHGNTQMWQREEDPGSGALNRVNQSGIRWGRRILSGVIVTAHGPRGPNSGMGRVL
jgi:hypothetical protein